MREITFDTETTGLEPSLGHRVIEIGCVELIDKVRTGKVYHSFLNPERDVPRSSTNIHGLTAGFLFDKPFFKDVAQDFLDFIADDKLVIHNAAFDLKFINSELAKVGLEAVDEDRAIDTVHLARELFPGAKASLDALCRRFGIDLSKREQHGALLDAELLADVYIELLGGNQDSMDLDIEELRFDEKNIRKTKYLERRSFPVSKNELNAHKNFLKKIKNPLWEQ